ncbi:MAG: hypothetical protein O9327_02280 [Polaromonas sp.]|nr:hypothetical protein [Polaromonas sp.]
MPVEQPTNPTGVSTKRGDQPAIFYARDWIQEVALTGFILTLAIAFGTIVFTLGTAIYKEMTAMPHQCAMTPSPVEHGSQA